MLTPFSEKVIAIIRRIPRGRVASYQQVAALAGREHASRAVAWILNSSSKKRGLPWQRVVSKAGRIAFKPGTHGFRLQRRLLRAEGVEVAVDGKIDMTAFQYRRRARRPKNGPRMFGS
jgi:methylated-DNA-protein-cysteine methyltransferase related protein